MDVFTSQSQRRGNTLMLALPVLYLLRKVLGPYDAKDRVLYLDPVLVRYLDLAKQMVINYWLFQTITCTLSSAMRQ